MAAVLRRRRHVVEAAAGQVGVAARDPAVFDEGGAAAVLLAVGAGLGTYLPPITLGVVAFFALAHAAPPSGCGRSRPSSLAMVRLISHAPMIDAGSFCSRTFLHRTPWSRSAWATCCTTSSAASPRRNVT